MSVRSPPFGAQIGKPDAPKPHELGESEYIRLPEQDHYFPNSSTDFGNGIPRTRFVIKNTEYLWERRLMRHLEAPPTSDNWPSVRREPDVRNRKELFGTTGAIACVLSR